MTRLRRVGLAFVFSVTLAGGVLVPQPAQAFALSAEQCGRIASAITSLTELAAKYPNNRLIAFILQEVQAVFHRYC
ncbi:MAG TPA: hypothetical protein VKD69_11690 [Vicinamibacterales bacterium]|nr:hypothetical protein [Vicinamibacterales bacterium]